MRSVAVILAGLGLLLSTPLVASAYTGFVWIDYLENQNHVYGSYKVMGRDFNGYYAGPWSAWYDVADGHGGHQAGGYRGLLFCVEASVPEPGGGSLHLHPYDPFDTDDYTPPNGNIFGMKWAAYLLNRLGPTVGGSEKDRSALQLAMWEALYDGDVNYAFDLHTTGKFYVKGQLGYYGGGGFAGAGFTSADVFAQAESFLGHYRGQGRAWWLHDGQDLLEDRSDPVPEPASLLLLGGGLIGSAVMALRRRRS